MLCREPPRKSYYICHFPFCCFMCNSAFMGPTIHNVHLFQVPLALSPATNRCQDTIFNFTLARLCDDWLDQKQPFLCQFNHMFHALAAVCLIKLPFPCMTSDTPSAPCRFVVVEETSGCTSQASRQIVRQQGTRYIDGILIYKCDNKIPGT